MKNNGMIDRPNLLNLLNDMSNERFIYICAPAGYGKTVAIRQWLENVDSINAGIALDEYDNDLTNFCRRFCNVLIKIQPENKTISEIGSHPAFNGSPNEFILHAVSALSENKHAILILDDVHFITDEKVLRLLSVLLKRLPENIQIILISRNDLPHGFSELWVKGQLKCITSEDLRFNEDEIMRLGESRGLHITQKQAKNISRYTDGWAIGVNAMFLSGEKLSVKNMDYLEQFIRSSVWEKWSEKIRKFMLGTAHVRELTPSLCTALTGVSDSGKMLDYMMRSGAFVTYSKTGVYRYHSLFQDFLKKMQYEHGKEYVLECINKEGQWYLTQKNFYSAADCFIRCQNAEGLGEAIDQLAITSREEFIIERLLPILQTPDFYRAAQHKPILFSYMAWASLAAGNAADMEVYADQFYSRFTEIIKTFPNRVPNIFLIYFIDYRVSLSNLINNASAQQIKPNTGTSPSSVSMNMPLLHRCARDFSEVAAGDIEQTIAHLKMLIGWAFGDEADLLEQCIKAGLYYEQGYLDKAHMYALAAGAEIRGHFVPEIKFCAKSILIYVLDALGLVLEAEQVVKQIEDMIERDRAYYLNRNFNALIIRRKLENGDMNAVRDWLGANDGLMPEDLSFYGIYSAFTDCRAYIASGDYNSAIILLKKVLNLAIAYRRPLDKIEAGILLAIACWKKKRGFQKEALEYLEEAVTEAYIYGYTQLFVNAGAELSGMMNRLLGRAEQMGKNGKIPVSFIKMLRLKMPETRNSGLTSGQIEQVQKYTEKQKAVMRLLCEGKSYKEITEILGIKLPTLRSHIALIYKKLDVTCEADAVRKIKSLGLL